MPSLRWSLLVAMLLAGAQAQAPDQTILRITVNLVQVDVSVTDSRGRQVTDLKADEFEVLQDGKRQKVTHCTYIRTVPESATVVARASAPAPRLGPLPPVPLRRDEVHRTIAVVVDDLNMSFEAVHDIRPALHKFIDEQIQAGDLVAIIRTAGDVGALQQFTSDKRKLHAIADRLKWYWQSSTGLNSFVPTGDLRDIPASEDEPTVWGGASGLYSDLETVRRLILVANGLHELPGRKSIVLFAEINLLSTEHPEAYMLFDRLADASGRAGAPIYAIDARGLPTLALRAGDNPRVRQPQNADEMVTTQLNDVVVGAQQGRLLDHLKAQESMRFLAQVTGGLFLRDTSSDLSVPLGKALDDQQGYYLLGYTPEASTFDPRTGQRKFHKISVRVKRKGMTVRTQSGFLGESDKDKTPPRGSTDAVVDALVSPFGSPEIEVGMTALFFNAAARGSYVTTLVNAKAGDLTFHDAADGRRETAGDVAVIVFADNGQIAEKTAISFTASLRPGEYDLALKNGFLFTLNLPVKKPGAYDVRVAVRDKASGKIGTAGEFVAIPDLKPQRMALSGILLETPLPPGAPETDLRGGTALRVFHPGDALTYGYQVLNPKLEPASRQPRLEARVKLYRDGKEFFVDQPAPIPVGSDVERLLAGGTLRIGPKMPPGEYVLETVVTDLLADKDNRTTAQWIDFRVTQ